MTHSPAFAASLLLALATASANAQPPTQSIEVRAPLAVRTDVQALCPTIGDDLNDALVKVVQELATPALIEVRFRLSGSRIDEVTVGDGPVRYQRALRRAVRGLACDGGAAAPQALALRVRFVDPFAVGERSRAVALAPSASAAR
jgi:hypothetical protein